jgi:hypothetical protein
LIFFSHINSFTTFFYLSNAHIRHYYIVIIIKLLLQVGLDVEPDWYNKMLSKFQGLLDRMEASDMPETAQYRIDVTRWCHFVLSTVREHGPDDPEGVERAVQMGQVEELLEMADDENIAMDTYLEVRMWELVEAMGESVVNTQPNPMEDPMADPEVRERNAYQGADVTKCAANATK